MRKLFVFYSKNLESPVGGITVIFGKYQLIERLGQGGMAEVFKAKSYGVEGFEKLLVIKRILSPLTRNSRFVEMFINEAKIAVSLSHVNIVQVFDLGKFDDSYFIAMEYVHGLDLATLLKKCEKAGVRLPQDLAIYIVSEVAKGLSYAHRRRDDNGELLNIVHRDISPHNILLSYEGEVKLADFGIAKARDRAKEFGRKSVKGKHAYMPPEQARGERQSQSVDIFSLGVVLYETLSGRNPFRKNERGHAETLELMESKSYPPVGYNSFEVVSNELESIVKKAMEPDPTDRFDSANEMYEQLVSCLFNLQKPVSSHDLARFLQDLQNADPVEGRSDKILGDFDSQVPLTSHSEEENGTESNTITSVQVPSSLFAAKDTGVSVTASHSVELWDVSILAMEFGGAGAPEDAVETFKEIITHHGGIVASARSDIILAVFGLQVSDGRDTQDAIDTGLRLQRAAMENEHTCSGQIGIGIHPARITLEAPQKIREDDSYFAIVSKVRALAKQGRGWVIASEEARQHVRDGFHFESMRIGTAQGKSENACRVLGRRPAPRSSGRFLGRSSELRTIGQVLAKVSRGQGHLIGLVGEAGMGKTRIIDEVQKRLVRKRYDVGWLRTTCVPWKKGTPLSAIEAMVRTSLGVRDVMEPEKLRRRVARMRELGLLPSEIVAIETVLGIHPNPNSTQPEEVIRRFRSGIVRAVAALCVDKMTVLIWDDFAHADRESVAMLRYLHEYSRELPLLIIVAYRPDAENSPPFEQTSNFTKVCLNPLSENESTALVLSRLERQDVDENLVLEIALKSGGNPLYIEEYVKTMGTSGLFLTSKGKITPHSYSAAHNFPKTLRALVGQRISKLPPSEKVLLQKASVIGQEFGLSVLAPLVDQPEDELKRSLLTIFDKGLLTRISQRVFAFPSDLIREVVYTGVEIPERREIHLAIAKIIEAIFIPSNGNTAKQLAVHYREGGDRQRAAEYFIKAGKKVASAYSPAHALSDYLEAFSLLENVSRPDEARLLTLAIDIGELAIKANRLDLGLEKAARGEALARKLGDQRSLTELLKIRAEIEACLNHHRASEYYITSANELAEKIGDLELQSRLHAAAGQIGDRLGDMHKAAYHYSKAIELSALLENSEFIVSARAALSVALAMSGELERARMNASQARKSAKDVSDPAIRCKVEQASGFVYYMLGDCSQSIKSETRALEIAVEHDLKESVAKSTHSLGDVYLSLGDFQQAFRYFRRSLDLALELEHQMLINLNAMFLAYIEAVKFDSADGVAKLEAALARANERNNVWEHVKAHYFLGKIHFERNQLDKAKFHLEKSLSIGNATENNLYEARVSDLLNQIGEMVH